MSCQSAHIACGLLMLVGLPGNLHLAGLGLPASACRQLQRCYWAGVPNATASAVIAMLFAPV